MAESKPAPDEGPAPAGADRETLERLLALQAESSVLDYKEELHTDQGPHLLALTKHMAAMAATGGHIVIGADGRGQPTGKVTERDCELFDESRLRAKVEKYLPAGIPFHAAWHEIDGERVVIVAVQPHPDGVCIIVGDGQHDGGCEFRAGDIFVRRGTTTVRANQEDVRGLLERLRRNQRESVRTELRAEWQAAASVLGPAGTGAELVRLQWALDLDALVEATEQHLLRGADGAIRRLLVEVRRQLAGYARESRGIERSADLLDRCAVLLGVFLVAERDDLFELVLRRLAEAYDGAVADQHPATAVPGAVMGMMVLERVQAVGAFAVRDRRFDLVREIALQRFRSGRRASSAWLKDMQRRAEDLDLYREPGGGPARHVWVLTRAKEAVARNPHLAPDILPDDEELMTSLCQFDLLAALAALATSESHHARVAHANFAGWYSHRTDPIVVELLDSTSDVRKAIFPGDDKKLAQTLVALAQHARPGAPWDGYEDERITEFLRRHGALGGGLRTH